MTPWLISMDTIIEVRRQGFDLHENPDDPSELTQYTRIWYSNGSDITYLDSMSRVEFGQQICWANANGHSPLPPVRH